MSENGESDKQGIERRGKGGWDEVLDTEAYLVAPADRMALGALPDRRRPVRACADTLGLSHDMRERLLEPRRSLIVNFPIRRDSGEVQEFTGYRVQHTLAMGPARAGSASPPACRSASAPRWRCG